jgi:hypothetical protein
MCSLKMLILIKVNLNSEISTSVDLFKEISFYRRIVYSFQLELSLLQLIHFSYLLTFSSFKILLLKVDLYLLNSQLFI